MSSTRTLRRGLCASSWSKSESWSFLPILNITKGLPAVHVLPPSASLFRAVVDMVKLRSGSLIVKQGDEMAGIITERDVLEKLPFELGASRRLKVSEVMTPRSSLVTAPPSFTLDQCVQAMQAGTFRHLPIMQGEQVKAVISMRDIAQHVAAALVKMPSSGASLTVAALMEAKGSGAIELAASQSVGEAVELMRAKKTGSVLVNSGDTYGIITERDFLTKVAVYDEFDPHNIPVTEIMTAPPLVKSVAPTGRIADCLALMVAGGFRHLPVAEKGKTVGVISMRDILNYFLAAAKN